MIVKRFAPTPNNLEVEEIDRRLAVCLNGGDIIALLRELEIVGQSLPELSALGLMYQRLADADRDYETTQRLSHSQAPLEDLPEVNWT